MKKLYLVRHAKSSWQFPELEDYERPLLEKGKKRTRKIIEFLLQKEVTLNLMISSPAVRCYDTAKYIAGAFGYPAEKILMPPLLYYGDHSSLLSIIMGIPSSIEHVMIIGHNPSITNLVNRFLDPPMDYLPTSGVICLHYDMARWELITSEPCQLEFIVYPRMIRQSQIEDSFELYQSAIVV